MKLVFTLLIFLSIAAVSQSQGTNRVWIYFKDKGPDSSDLTKITEVPLSSRALQRRERQNINIDETDLAIYDKYLDTLENLGIKIYRKSRWLNAVSVYLNGNHPENLKNLSFVTAIEPVRTMRNRYTEPDSKLMLTKPAISDYGLSQNQNEMLGIPYIHNLGYSGEDVRVAVFDTGFLLTHEALQHINVIDTYDFIQNDKNVSDEDGDMTGQHNHGTRVLGVLGGYSPGNLIGPAYSAEYALAKTEDVSSETHIEEDNWIAAAEWADSLGADIISSSLGYSEFDKGEEDYTYEDMDGKTTVVTRGANWAVMKGISVFTSAGNEGQSSWYYITAPADGFGVIAMGGVRADETYWPTSSKGPTFDGRIKPDLAAQGQGVYSVVPGTADQYSFGAGTSFSAPLGSGAGALVLNMSPGLNPKELRTIMTTTASLSHNPDNFMGYGIINLEEIAAIVNDEPFVSVQSFSGQPAAGNNKLEWISNVEIRNEEWIISRALENGTIEQVGTLEGEEFNLRPKQYKFIDNNIQGGEKYIYILANRSESDNVTIHDTLNIQSQIPHSVRIISNYPNPFNSTTTISFSLNIKSKIRLEIYDILGNKIKTLINDEVLEAQFYKVIWQGQNNHGVTVASGTYYLFLRSEGGNSWQKLVLVK